MRSFWESFGDDGLVARPFADIGGVRYIRFSALGTDWTLATTNDIESGRMAERFAAAAQVMLAALAQDDLCMIETHINVRIENARQASTLSAEPIKSLPSNVGREWAVRLTPVETSTDTTWKETDIELMTMLTVILRGASLLPETDFSASLERAFARGLMHKLSPGRPYDELAATFAVDTGSAIPRVSYNTPWECRDGSSVVHPELRWQDGPGPTYSRDKANELLETRYQNLAKSLRITLIRLAFSEEFLRTVEELRKRGWLDWHIVNAAFNVVMNYRFSEPRFNMLSKVTQREMMQAAFSPESGTAEPVPLRLFNLEAMDDGRRIAMLSLVKHWGLECRQTTPDISAIERLLANRYGYWEDDALHDDPFPDKEGTGGLMVIEDSPPS